MSLKNGLKSKAALCLTVVALSLQHSPSALAAVSAGSKCSKVGTTTISNKVKYQCVSSGKKKIWRIVKVTKPVLKPEPPTTPTSATTTPTIKIDDFSTFACDANDSRLKNLTLPKGDSLEIRAAAACLALSFIENPVVKSKINVALSPNFQPSFYKTLERSVGAADRIFGHFGYSESQTIEVFGSDDANWLCKYGSSVYFGRSNISWQNMPDSGCNGNTQGRARADVVDSGKTPALWFFTS
ncbi:MAG: hypothetical protein F2803_04350, partial [Actinobacteria bacterium]|nr:hypothetical protein [Actinomycetota bacterium]